MRTCRLFTRLEPDALVVQFDRDGEVPQQQLVLSGGGRKALLVAMTMLLQREACR